MGPPGVEMMVSLVAAVVGVALGGAAATVHWRRRLRALRRERALLLGRLRSLLALAEGGLLQLDNPEVISLLVETRRLTGSAEAPRPPRSRVPPGSTGPSAGDEEDIPPLFER